MKYYFLAVAILLITCLAIAQDATSAVGLC